jgi:hypothetical protein
MRKIDICWARAYFEKEAYFWRKGLFWGACLFLEKISILGKTYFWKGRPNIGARATGGKKEACIERRKRNM